MLFLYFKLEHQVTMLDVHILKCVHIFSLSHSHVVEIPELLEMFPL